MVGPIERATYAHLLDEARQEAAYAVLGDLTGVVAHPALRAAS